MSYRAKHVSIIVPPTWTPPRAWGSVKVLRFSERTDVEGAFAPLSVLRDVIGDMLKDVAVCGIRIDSEGLTKERLGRRLILC